MHVTYEILRNELVYQREQAGLKQTELSARVNISAAYLSQIEGGVRRARLPLCKRLDQELGTDGVLTRMATEVERRAQLADYYVQAATLAQQALVIAEYASALVPGLLQTRDYATAVVEDADPEKSEEAVTAAVDLRMERASILKCPHKPRLRVILHETALFTSVGCGRTMYEQLLKLVGLGRRRRLTLQVLEAKEGSHALMGSMLTLMEFEASPPVAYLESAYSGDLVESPDTVDKYMRAYEQARALSLPPQRSLNVLESVAKEYHGAVADKPSNGRLAQEQLE
ncbi:helix-turn-helix domain-containing protein [Streptomyces paromomycinus]|uniref:Transcriptional regulator n=1 Tax=Streptomyces paromomycinus TaxID=92743 RepID=A0A401W8A2_STREY|nr:helix-turn-helix transcriptional regulator [Streptomyces paromomycinus]GCD45491.1 transcriptional regulator [Streptomyces paromomycinus]